MITGGAKIGAIFVMRRDGEPINEMKRRMSPRFAWYTYDWANSAFSTSVVTVFFGPYLTKAAEVASHEHRLAVLGWDIHPGAWFSFVVSASVIAQVFLLPIVGSIVDGTALKRRILGGTAYVGAVATMLLYFMKASTGDYMYGGALFVIANVFFGASIVVYNAFLPAIAPSAERDAVSSRGWALGYLGGGLLLFGHLIIFQSADTFVGGTEQAIRVILASTGVWWALFTLVPMRYLPARIEAVHNRGIVATLRQLIETLRNIMRYPQAARFLVAYLLYNDAVQTVITMASVFGHEELGLDLGTLTTAILMVQFVAIVGSLGFERLAHVTSTKGAIMATLFGWAIVLFAAWGWVQTATEFYVLAAVIALILGGTQALSRSLFSQLIPRSKAGEYFALYEISDKGTSWIGTLLFGIALTMTSSYRWAIFSLIVFVALGTVLLSRVNVQQGIESSGQVDG